ncbi:AbiEi antitoxin N-terminal domain-containing protein [Paraburkholderia youngii]|uniref:AbiEi antitoxin N-terminal domain-containing protein n=1 Tax=Paraburkholderia youngii TaxID=2782701 RepID=UPI0026DFC74E|nr:AbiEi antitoxin N-terminal domain-containing protein [Paraburkholderia youngii]
MDFAPRGEPMDLTLLAQFGIEAGDASGLVEAGWLRQLAGGAFLLRGDSPTPEGTVAFLARKIPGLHVGGKAALDMQGMRYHVYARPRMNLWGDVPWDFPEWVRELLLPTYDHERLFNEGLKAGYAVSPLPARNPGMPVSAPERAILEHLAGSGQSEMLRDGNASLVGMLRNFRLNVLQELVDRCVRKDVVWALKLLGEDENFAWANQLQC